MEEYSTQSFEMSPTINITTELSLLARYPDLSDLCRAVSPAYHISVRYLPPLWYTIGFPCNLLAFGVWIQPKMRPSSGLYLAALAMSDFVFLLLQLVFVMNTEWKIPVLDHNFICQVFPILFMASQYLNPLLMLAFTVERYIAICHPFVREKYCTTSRAVGVIILLVVLTIALHAIQGYFWFVSNGICSPRPDAYEGGPKSLWSIWSWITELLVFGVVPLAILGFNIRVIKEAGKIQESENKILKMLQGQKVTKPTGASATTFMLLAVSFYMILTTLPVTILYVLYPIFKSPTASSDIQIDVTDVWSNPAWKRYLSYTITKVVIERMGLSHYACNFFIYLATGAVFRSELKYLLFFLICRKGERHSRHSERDDLLSTYCKPTASQNGTATHFV